MKDVERVYVTLDLMAVLGGVFNAQFRVIKVTALLIPNTILILVTNQQESAYKFLLKVATLSQLFSSF